MRSTKKSLIASALSLVLCISMLLGTTYAWFTDSVTSGKNRIVAGNLKVDLIMDKNANGEYVSIANEEGAIFGEGSIAQNNSAVTLWEPGKTQIVYLGVKNAGTLALKYNMLIDVKDEGLIGALEYAFIDGAKAADLSPAEKWSDITSVDGVVVADVVAGRTKAAQNGVLDEIAKGTVDETDYFALAVHMKEDAGNAYKDKGITIDVTVMATQVEAENDSFDNTYDKDVEIPTLAGNYPPLEEMFTALSSGDVDEIPETVAVINPTTISSLKDENGKCDYESEIRGSDINTTIDLQNDLSVGEFEWNFGAMRVVGGAEVTFKGNDKGRFINEGSSAHSLLYVEGQYTVNIESGTYESATSIFSCGFSIEPQGAVNISGGTFKFIGADKDNQVPFSKKGWGPFKAFYTTGGPALPLNITGGTFYNCDPTGFVAAGHTVSSQVVGNDIIYTVS